MFVFDEEELSQFFENVSSGFKHSPLEIAIVIILVIAFLSFLLLSSRIQRARAHRRYLKLHRRKYQELKKRLDLNPSEEGMIQQLSEFLKYPEKKYLLLLHQSTFNSCVEKLRAQEDIPAVTLSGLRMKLGFRVQDPERIPSSSAELPEGLPVLLLSGGLRRGERIPGRVMKSEPQFLVVRPDEKAKAFPVGTPLSLYFQKRSGLFTLSSTVQANKDGMLHLDHSDTIKRYQRRTYYRKKVMLPVFLKPAGSEEPPVSSVLMDLGGGGASLQNPDRRFKTGEDLELSFRPKGGSRLSIIAEVLRLSRGGRVLHVRFGTMQESTRDRIIGSLFRK